MTLSVKLAGYLRNASIEQDSHAHYGAPILFVTKKDGGLRLCGWIRALNKITVKRVPFAAD